MFIGLGDSKSFTVYQTFHEGHYKCYSIETKSVFQYSFMSFINFNMFALSCNSYSIPLN